MKRISKIAALMLALVMVMSMAMTALAEETGSITIKNAVVGQTYTIYQILKLESYNKEDGAYVYKAAEPWNSFINSSDIKDVYVKVDGQGYISWIQNADVVAFAKLAQKYAADNKIAYQGSQTPETADENKNTATVTFSGLNLGYYLLDSTLGTLCSLDTTNPEMIINEKNAAPVNVKTVEEDSTGTYGEKNDADIGQTVNFKSTITAQEGAENYVFHDKMSDGLTYTGVTGITLNGNTVGASDYTVTAPAADGDTFDVVFTQTFCDTLKANDKIVISYAATLNEKAVIAGVGNPNESKLSYGDSSNIKTTPPSKTITYTWDVDVFKYTSVNETNIPLAGASFTLSKHADGSDPIAMVTESNNVYRVARTGETDTVTEITTDSTGKFTIKGLDSDTYYLTETKAPDGYKKLAGPVAIVIGENGATSVNNETVDEVKILNDTGVELPDTGGIGTTVFYVIGLILIVGAGALLIVNRRRNGKR